MPDVRSTDGVRIHYEVEGRGAPLVLVHGFTGSGQDWRDFGYVEALRNECQLILIDTRGHGQSDKPHEAAAHTTDQYARDVVAVLDRLGIETAHYWGYSMGGYVGWAAALIASDRFRSFVIGGDDPWWTPEWGTFADEIIGTLEQGMDTTLAAFEEWLGPWPEPLRQRTLANDPQALIARFRNTHVDLGYRERLGEIAQPVLLYRAEGDEMAERAADTVAALPHGRLVDVPGLNHATAFYRSDLILPTVREFLAGQDEL